MRLGRRAFLAAAFATRYAPALGRVPSYGTLSLELPFRFDAVDPHSADDAASALFAPAIADTLFAWDPSSRPYPALAAAMPEAVAGGTRVALRPGLVTARGRPLDARDVVASLARARARAARPLLAAFGKARQHDALTIVVPGATPEAVADALASPVTAIVPRGFSAEEPDGTGAFRATRTPDGMAFERNERAARGPAFLDRILVRHAPDLASSLRAFESGDADVGWLGAGLHRRRAGAIDFRTGRLGFVVLRTGSLAGNWSSPGIAERLVIGMDPARFAHLALVRHGAVGAEEHWGGAPADLVVDGGSPYLVEVATVVAGILSEPGHEIRVAPLPGPELRSRIQQRRYALAIDIVRLLGPSERHLLLSLLEAADPALADHPPNLATPDVDTLGRTLPLAVLGELAVVGARVPDVHGLAQWDLGSVYRDRR